MLRPNSIFQSVIAVTMLAMLAGCGQGVNFDPQASAKSASQGTDPSGGGSGGGPGGSGTCNNGNLFGSRLTKIMFLVDTSGSNVEYTDATMNTVCTALGNVGCYPPTDPNKTFRMGSIQNFFNQYKTKSNIQWGFVTFSGTTATPLISDGSGSAIFDANPADMQAAINQFAGITDDGGTPYHAAITQAEAAVSTDPDKGSPSDPQYYVILLTDGFPTDYANATAASPDVSALIGSAAAVSLSTIFYGPQGNAASTSAINLLTAIAQMGRGQFANVNNPSSGININDVITNPGCGP